MLRHGQPILPLMLAVALCACNGAPEGGAAAILPEAPTTTDNLDLVIVEDAVDPNGNDTVSYDIAWFRDGTEVVALSSLSEVNSSLTSKGEVWSVEVTPTDGAVAGETFTAEATVVNAAPTANSVTLSPVSPAEGDTVQATAVGTDADLDDVGFSYAWFVDGAQVDETSAQLSSDAFDKGASIYVEVTPNDGDIDGEPLASDPVVAVNTLPTATSAQISPMEDAREGSTLTCAGSGWNDADGDTEDYDIAWLVNGEDAGASDSLTGSSFNRGESVVCSATPNDGEATGEPVLSSAVVIQNTAPALVGAALSNPAPVEGDTLSLSLGDSSDADGDSVTFSYDWYVNDTKIGSDETLGSDWFAKGDTIYAMVTPSDDADAGAAVKSDVATVANTAPSVTSVSLSGPITAESSSITATATGADVDGDSLSYSATWYVNGTATTGSSMTLSTAFKKGDKIYAVVSADDGDDVGTMTSDTVSVQNTAPGSATVSMSDATPDEADDIVCTIDTAATDIDDDTLSYRFTWKRDGVDWTGSMASTTYSNDTIGSASTAGDEVWTCSVAAYDGTAYGAAVTASATVQSTWPGTATFSTCASTGYTGPSQSQCDAAYTGVLKGQVTVTGGIQEFTVPGNGTYRIEAWGAQGGKCGERGCGGKGARMRGDFSLKKGDVLRIVVGQEGGYKGFGSGGGGGTYVVKKSGTTALVIAGAGGGAGHTGTVGDNGTTSTCGTAGSYGSPGAGGCSGLGGASSSSYGGTYNNSGGGGGFTGDGVGDGTKTNPGLAFANGSAGGMDTGGFGGGGGGIAHAWDCSNGNGGGSGGGGYSGGGGGGGSCNGSGGGGGSYNGGSGASNSSGVQSGDGKVVISRL